LGIFSLTTSGGGQLYDAHDAQDNRWDNRDIGFAHREHYLVFRKAKGHHCDHYDREDAETSQRAPVPSLQPSLGFLY
jgi:hypothetical protein